MLPRPVRPLSARDRARRADTPDEVVLPTQSAVATALRECFRAVSGIRVYGIVDAARSVDLAYEAKLHFGKEIRNLFLPEVEKQLWDVAPYLVPIDPASGYLDNWARRWGESAGILLTTKTDEATLYAHLRKMFVVEDEEKQEYFFRYYDPRVLRAFLPTCSATQLEEFFGPIAEFTVEDDAGETLVQFRRTGEKLSMERGRLEVRNVQD
jgi:hypothetical protein